MLADSGGAAGVTFGLAEFIAAEEMGRTAATGGPRTARRCWWRGWTRRRYAAGTSPTPPTPSARPRWSAYPAAGHPERRGVPRPGPARRHHRGRRDRRRRVSLPGHRRLGGRARPARRGAEPGPAHDAAAVRRPGHRPGRGAARGHRPGLAGDRPRRPGLDRGRPPGVDRRPRGHPPPAGGPPGCPAGAEPVTPPGLQVRGVLGVDGDTVLFQASGRAHRDRAVGLRPRRAEPGQRRRHASRPAPAAAGPR